MTRQWQALRFRALDVLYFRDGRSLDSFAQIPSITPTPQVAAGALRAALLERHGVDFKKMARKLAAGSPLPLAVDAAGGPAWIGEMQVAGPWFARKKQVFLPSPVTLYSPAETPGENFYRLDPLHPGKSMPGWTDSTLRPLWPQQVPPSLGRDVLFGKPAGGCLTVEGMRTFLDGGVPGREQWVSPDSLYGLDERTGIGMDSVRNVAAESQIYALAFLSLAPEVELHVEVTAPSEAAEEFASLSTLPLGGEGRHVSVTVTESIMPRLETNVGGPSCFVLSGPALFEEGWTAPALRSSLVGAAAPGWQTISGWDMARKGPKPARHAVNPGSVYFYDAPMPHDHIYNASLETVSGFGHAFKGVWAYV